MILAIDYLRYSSDNQREESIFAQRRAIKEYAQKHGIRIIREYIDEAKSAKSDDRPNFMQMMDDITSGAVTADLVLVHKLDRFARNRYDSAIYHKKLKDMGMRLIATSQPMDDSPESVILESVLEAMAEYYSLNLGREVMKGLKENALQGKHTGGLPPLGYDVDPQTKKYIINEREAVIVRLIYDMASNGKSYIDIIHECNIRGYKTKRDKPFGKNSIHSILKNEKYTGLYIFNKLDNQHNSHKYKPRDQWIILEGAIPQIIEREKWEEVQEILEGRTKQRNRSERPYLLTGKVVCGECGGAYVGSRAKGRNKDSFYYYLCSAKKRLGNCQNSSIRADYLENYVLDRMDEKCFPKTKEDIEILVEQLVTANNIKMKNENKELEDLKTEIVTVDNKINKLFDAYENETMPEELVSQRLNVLKEQKNTLQERIVTITKSKPTFTAESLKAFYMKNKNSLAVRDNTSELQRLINVYVKEVVISPGSGSEPERITVYLKHDCFGYYGSGEGIIVISETITKQELYHKYRKKSPK